MFFKNRIKKSIRQKFDPISSYLEKFNYENFEITQICGLVNLISSLNFTEKERNILMSVNPLGLNALVSINNLLDTRNATIKVSDIGQIADNSNTCIYPSGNVYASSGNFPPLSIEKLLRYKGVTDGHVDDGFGDATYRCYRQIAWEFIENWKRFTQRTLAVA